ncbi:hypothetical protein J7E62_02825 [Variovorax paradoxus]|nr:hypothetical protein [Variovorax paradoxus]
MTFASGSFGQLRYIPETVRGTVPVAGNAINLRMVEPTMKAAVETTKSSEVNANRMSSGNTRVDQNVDGGFNFELSAAEYDPFLESIVGGTFAHYGTNGLGAAFAMQTTATSVEAAVAPTGSSAFSQLVAGSWFKLVPGPTASAAAKAYFADAWFKVGAGSTSDSLAVDAATPIVAPGLIGADLADSKISQSIIVNGSARKTFSFEHTLTDVGSRLLYTGMEPNTMELNVEVGSIITGSFGFIGQTHDVRDGASYLPGAPVASKSFDVMNAVTDVGTVFEGDTNLLAGGSFIKSLSLSLNNNARGQKAVGVFGNAGVGLGEFEISGSMQVYFEDATYYKKWLDGERTSLTVGFCDSQGNGYLFELDKVMFRDGGLNPGGNNEDVMLDLPFDAFYDAATGRGIRITRALAA